VAEAGSRGREVEGEGYGGIRLSLGIYLGTYLQKKAAQSFLGMVLAENRMDQAPQMVFSEAREQEGSLARCMQKGEDVAFQPYRQIFLLAGTTSHSQSAARTRACLMPTPVVAFSRSHLSLGSNLCGSTGSCGQGESSEQATCKLARLDTLMVAARAAPASQHGHLQPDGARLGIREVEKKGLRWGEPQRLTGLSKGGVWGRVRAEELLCAHGREIVL